jgi:hypothetical protein
MKKNFPLTAPNKAPARQVDSVKHEIKKYISRERKKLVPESFDFWDFDCKFGEDQAMAKTILVSEINKAIDLIVSLDKQTFYIEIIAKPGHKIKSK